MPPVLVKALLRYWWTPEFALASARVGYEEALASGCPIRTHEYRRAVMWLEWIVGPAPTEWDVPSLREVLEEIELEDEETDED